MKKALVIGSLAALLATGNANAQQASYPYDGPLPAHVDRTTFGILPSTGDAVLDCGEWADNTTDQDLPDEAIEVIEKCLDLHGWTYDED
jgi:hypothetical protein